MQPKARSARTKEEPRGGFSTTTHEDDEDDETHDADEEDKVEDENENVDEVEKDEGVDDIQPDQDTRRNFHVGMRMRHNGRQTHMHRRAEPRSCALLRSVFSTSLIRIGTTSKSINSGKARVNNLLQDARAMPPAARSASKTPEIFPTTSSACQASVRHCKS